jgi:hypothetical protein
VIENNATAPELCRQILRPASTNRRKFAFLIRGILALQLVRAMLDQHDPKLAHDALVWTTTWTVAKTDLCMFVCS